MNFSKTLNRTLNFIFVEAEFNLGFSVILVKISVKLVLKQRFCCFIAAKYCCPAARSVPAARLDGIDLNRSPLHTALIEPLSIWLRVFQSGRD
jgi:hypothetical protein